MILRVKRFPAAIVAVGLAAFACNRPQPQTREPASAPSRAVDDDAELGRLADERVMSELSVLADAPLAAYVNGVLSAVARQANPTATRWTLRLLDSSHVSVRSGPGGYVYVTRGFLACLGSEAELAAALAHEVAHVSERHWRRQAEYLVKRGVEDGDLDKLPPDDRLALLARLRDEERTADRLALGYLERAGYARGGLAKVLRLFAELERLAGGSRVPPLLRTHPVTGERLRALEQQKDPGGEWKAREYLSKIDGLPFGEDPRDGYLYGDRYVVPNADFELVLPSLWRAQLIGKDLMAALPGKATILLVARSEHGSLERTLDALGKRESFTESNLGGQRVFVAKSVPEGALSSLSWVFDTPVAPLVLALVVPRGDEETDAVKALLGGVGKISNPALKNLGVLRIRLTTLERETSLRALFAENPPRTNLATLALINGVGPDQPLPAGSVVKRVDP